MNERGKTGRKSGFECVRWSIFLVLAVSYILVYFHRMAPGVIADDIMKSFGSTGAALGALAATYFLIYAAMQIPAGILSDHLGPRITVTAGNLTAGIGSILFGLAATFDIACSGRFLVGLGVSVIFISTIKSNSVWFSARRFALMSGLTGFIGNAGSVLSAGPLAWTLNSFSWRFVFVGLGVFSIALGIIGFLVIRNRPEDAGYPPVHPSAPSGDRQVHAHWMKSLVRVAKAPGIWAGFWVNFGVLGGLYAFMGLWGVPFLRDAKGMSRSEASGYMTVLLIAYTFGILFSGWITDHLGRRKPVLMTTAVFTALAWFSLIYLPWKPGFSGMLLFAFLGIAGTGTIATFATAKESTDPSLAGTASSLVNTGTFLATLIVQPILGWVLDRGWDGTLVNGARAYSAENYHDAFLVVLAFSLVGIAGALSVRETGGKGMRHAGGADNTGN